MSTSQPVASELAVLFILPLFPPPQVCTDGGKMAPECRVDMPPNTGEFEHICIAQQRRADVSRWSSPFNFIRHYHRTFPRAYMGLLFRGPRYEGDAYTCVHAHM